ncbi:type II inositol 3,4-bisphosphate 4-phosphatase-like isoform X2 [Salvelinus fontinalis]|uniref:type II inositol 3,4-bisphosphate 4-phosphatase-like isoform X2 n=1 Tax=Salvelinus fontinalis TaxID=8038 RepID=UPI002485FEB3|nr:type II inositol 3,4-bisphosphate 4-phosphatase-like isoform X2 [Salvelinus fontinalis]
MCWSSDGSVLLLFISWQSFQIINTNNILTHDILLPECRDLIGSGRDRKPNALVQVAVIDPREQYLVSHACTEIVEGSRDPLFLTGVTFPPEYPASPETLVKLTVYDVRDKARDNVSKSLSV